MRMNYQCFLRIEELLDQDCLSISGQIIAIRRISRHLFAEREFMEDRFASQIAEEAKDQNKASDFKNTIIKYRDVFRENVRRRQAQLSRRLFDLGPLVDKRLNFETVASILAINTAHRWYASKCWSEDGGFRWLLYCGFEDTAENHGRTSRKWSGRGATCHVFQLFTGSELLHIIDGYRKKRQVRLTPAKTEGNVTFLGKKEDSHA